MRSTESSELAATDGTTSAAAPARASEACWTVRLLGAVEARRGAQLLARLPTRAITLLLARLALEPGRFHSREELVELIWPGVALAVGRNRLRQALSTLKGLLEPPGAAAVLQADRLGIRVHPGALDSDARQFERRLNAGDLAGARACWRGELLPGCYEDWVIDERRRLATLHERLGAAPLPGNVVGPAADPEPAAPRVEDGVVPLPSGLPSYWTRAFGAELTASRLHALVGAQRLVTVHGPGGSGKTRLAVEVAQALRDGRAWSPGGAAGGPRFDRVVFVPLVDCVSEAQALDAIRSALHLGSEGDPRARIAAALSGRRTLLVLDNVEQLVDAAGREIARLLAGAPLLHVLVTSRRLLEIDGEHAYPLDGLPLPPADAAAEAAAANPAVALFLDRARAARADFRLGARNARAVVALTRLLGGMPLAIELAASRVRSLTPQELLQRLSEDAGTPMLDLLARGTRRASADARHASMRHVVDWSWQQLTPAQQAMLQALSVFAASAALGAVAAVAGTGAREAQVLLDELRDASLVQAVQQDDEPARYLLLQPVREFAAERQSAPLARVARQRLRAWLIDFARAATARGPAAVAPELPHVHAAIGSALADGAAREALALALALRAYWDSDDLPPSGVLALEQALDEVDPAEAALRADAHELLAYARAVAGGITVAVAHARASVAAAPDDRRRSLALSRWAWALYAGGDLDAERLSAILDEAQALAQRCGDPAALAIVLRVQALVACNLRLDYPAAEAMHTRAQRLWEQLGNRPMAYTALLNRATMWAWLGRNEEALGVLGDCVSWAHAEGDWVAVMNAGRQRARVLIRLRRWDEAAEAFRLSLRVGWERHYARGLANALLNLPEALAMGPRPDAAARLLGFAQAHWARLYGAINRIETAEIRRAGRALRLRLGAPRREALLAEGGGMDLAAAVALALDEGTAGPAP